MNKYRMLISGCGSAGMNVAKVAVQSGRAEIVGLFDPLEVNLSKAAATYPQAATGSIDLDGFFKTAKPDTAVIAGPDHLHANQTVMAFDYGCNVLLEKPFATTVADSWRIIKKQEQTCLTLMTDHTERYTYPWKETAQAARSGIVGRIFFIEGDYVHDMWDFYSPLGKYSTPWRADTAHPQNILLGGGCHAIDLMLWTMHYAPVESVFAFSNKLSMPEFPSDDCYIVVLRFENGTTGKILVTSGCSGHGMGSGRLAVYGTEGTLWLGKLYRRDKETEELPRAAKDNTVGNHGWGGSVLDFLDVLDERMENPIPPRAAAKVVGICEAAFESLRTGRPQKPVSF